MGFTMPRREKVIWPDIPNGYPHPPRNVIITSPYTEGALDIRWDNPAHIPENVGTFFLNIFGVNIYRSRESQFGPWEKINDAPVGALTFRDETQHQLVLNEDVTGMFISKDNQTDTENDPNQTLTFTVKNPPITQPNPRANEVSDYSQVKVTFTDSSGEVKEAVVGNIDWLTGRISLVTKAYLDAISLRMVEPNIPDLNNPATRVYCTYYRLENFVDTTLDRRTHYKLTTVAEDKKGNFVETPIEYAIAEDSLQFEKLDYMWREATRRNKWILEQGGERVKVMVRKWIGEPCKCESGNPHSEVNNFPRHKCKVCFGTGVIGGYEGPFDLLIPPPDTERQINPTERGLRLIYTYECWTGPTPRLTERDILIKPNGERYILGPVSPVVVRGVMIQQSFSVQYVEVDDIIYKVPLGGKIQHPVAKKQEDKLKVLDTSANPDAIPDPQIGKKAFRPSELSPYISDHCRKPPSLEQKGRTKTWENITY